MKVFKPSKITTIRIKLCSLKNYVCTLFKRRTTNVLNEKKEKHVSEKTLTDTDKLILSLENDIKRLRAEVDSIKQQMNKRPMRLISTDAYYRNNIKNVECVDCDKCDICLQAKLYDTHTNNYTIEGFAEKKVKIT